MDPQKFKESWTNLGCSVIFPSEADLTYSWSQENREFLSTYGIPSGNIFFPTICFDGFNSIENNPSEDKIYFLKSSTSFYVGFNMSHVIAREKNSSSFVDSIEAPNLLKFFLILLDCFDARKQFMQYDNLSEKLIENRSQGMRQCVKENLGCVTQFWDEYIASIQYNALDFLRYLRDEKDTSIENEECFDEFYDDYDDLKLMWVTHPLGPR